MRPSNLIITPEGYPFIAYSFGLFLLLATGGWFLGSVPLAVPAVITFLLFLFVVSFFRNPERRPPEDEALIVAPADGTIVYIGTAEEEHMGVCTKISIFMSVFNVHVNRSPFSGTVVERFYRRGKFFDARSSKASCENEQCGVVLESPTGKRFVFVQIAGLIARRILCYVEKGDSMERGKRYGMIRFGSRVDLYLPKGLEILAVDGQSTVAGETAIARLV